MVCGCASALSMEMTRSEEHTSGLQSHRDLHSFPTRRSSDLVVGRLVCCEGGLCAVLAADKRNGLWVRECLVDGDDEIGRAHVWTPVTPRSTLFPYTTLFRSRCRPSCVLRGRLVRRARCR